MREGGRVEHAEARSRRDGRIGFRGRRPELLRSRQAVVDCRRKDRIGKGIPSDRLPARRVKRAKGAGSAGGKSLDHGHDEVGEVRRAGRNAQLIVHNRDVAALQGEPEHGPHEIVARTGEHP